MAGHVPLSEAQKARIRKQKAGWIAANKQPKSEKVVGAIKYTKSQTQAIKRTLNEGLDLLSDFILDEYNRTEGLPEFNEFLDALDAEYSAGGFLGETIAQTSENAVEYLDEWHQNAFYRKLQDSIGVDVKIFISEMGMEEVRDKAVESVSSKLKDLYGFSIKRSKELVSNALLDGTIFQGQEKAALEREIRKGMNKLKNPKKQRSTEFYARDITQRVVNAFNRERQERAGIKEYKWVTSRDKRVRPEHAIMHGLKVKWESGTIVTDKLSKERGVAGKKVDTVAGGHPGSEYNCRCSASAILEI